MSTTSQPQQLLAGQHAAPPGSVDLTMMYVMHHAFRRDLLRFRGATENADIGDRARWRALHERWQLFSTILHHHHAAEDAGLWPLLLERVNRHSDDDARGVLEAMAAEHALIDPSLDACAEAFAALAESADEHQRGGLRRSLDDAWQLLDGHMGHEERDAMALVQRYLETADWQRVEREHFRPAYSLRAMLKVVPWAVSGLPTKARQTVLADAGPAMGLMWLATRGTFARAEAQAFGANPAGMVDARSRVAVVGATGTVGGHVLDALVAKHADVRVVVRRARPVDAFAPDVTQVVADLHDEQALRTALEGVGAALYVSPHDVDEEELAANFVRAAEAAGTRVVFAGLHIPARNPVGWLQLMLAKMFLPTYRGKLRIGRLIAQSQTDPVVFSPTNFFQNDEIFDEDIRDGRFPLPMRRVNRMDVRDLAELCARALLEPGHPAGEHTVAGPVSLTGEECARFWGRSLGRAVKYVGDDESLWLPIFKQRLQGQKLVDLINTSRFLASREVVLPRAVAATRALLGRDPRSYSDYVAERAGRGALSSTRQALSLESEERA